MGRLESVQEASNASLPRTKEEEERSKRSKEEEGRWKSEEWERSVQVLGVFFKNLNPIFNFRDEAFMSMIATRLSKREPRQEVTEL